MPRVGRQSIIKKHIPSARPAGARHVSFANATAGKPETINEGPITGASGPEILSAITRESEAGEIHLSKKEKQRLRREAFVRRLQSSSTPYARPEPDKRQAKKLKSLGAMKESLTTGMPDISAALEEILVSNLQPTDSEVKIKKIGPASAKMTSARKKDILQQEQKRLALVQQHPSFMANPFASIRLISKETLDLQDLKSTKNEKA